MIAIKKLRRYIIKPSEADSFKKEGYTIVANEAEAKAYINGYKAGCEEGKKEVLNAVTRYMKFIDDLKENI